MLGSMGRWAWAGVVAGLFMTTASAMASTGNIYDIHPVTLSPAANISDSVGSTLDLDQWLQSVDAISGDNWNPRSVYHINDNAWIGTHGIPEGESAAYIMDATGSSDDEIVSPYATISFPPAIYCGLVTLTLLAGAYTVRRYARI